MHGPISVHDTGLTLSLVIPPRQRSLFIRRLETASLVHARVADMCVYVRAGSAQRVAVGNGVQRSAGDKNFSLFDYRNFRSRLRGNGDSTSKGF